MTPQTPKAPRGGSKQAKLVFLMSRKSYVTLTKAGEALGWQGHTVSAAITEFRKRGYVIERTARENKDSVYSIIGEESATVAADAQDTRETALA